MKKAIQREMIEEAKINPIDVKDFQPLPLVYKQEWPESGLKNAYFIYQYWYGTITDTVLFEAQQDMRNLVRNPELKEMLPADFTEKDAVKWWSPKYGWNNIRDSFSKKMTHIYYDYLKYGETN